MTAKTVKEIAMARLMIVMSLNNVRRMNQEVPWIVSHSGTAMDEYGSRSSEDTRPYWNTFEKTECAPYCEPID